MLVVVGQCVCVGGGESVYIFLWWCFLLLRTEQHKFPFRISILSLTLMTWLHLLLTPVLSITSGVSWWTTRVTWWPTLGWLTLQARVRRNSGTSPTWSLWWPMTFSTTATSCASDSATATMTELCRDTLMWVQSLCVGLGFVCSSV